MRSSYHSFTSHMRRIAVLVAVVLALTVGNVFATCATEERDPVGSPARRILDANGKPVRGAHITVWRSSQRVHAIVSVKTGRKGVVRLALPSGTYTVQVKASGFLTHQYTLALADKPDFSLSVVRLVPSSECRDMRLGDFLESYVLDSWH